MESLTIPSDQAFEIDQQIRQAAYSIYGIGRQIGNWLYQIQESGAYKALGFDTWHGYCESLPFSFSTANRLKENYRVFILGHAVEAEVFDQIDSEKLSIIRNKVDSENVQELVNKALVLTRKDLRMSFAEEKTGTPYPHTYVCKCHSKWGFNIEPEELCPKKLREFAEYYFQHNPPPAIIEQTS